MKDIFSISFNLKVCCVFSLESPHSNKHTQYTIFNIKHEITLNYTKSVAMGFFPRDSRTSLNSRSKRAISVRATKGMFVFQTTLYTAMNK